MVYFLLVILIKTVLLGVLCRLSLETQAISFHTSDMDSSTLAISRPWHIYLVVISSFHPGSSFKRWKGPRDFEVGIIRLLALPNAIEVMN